MISRWSCISKILYELTLSISLIVLEIVTAPASSERSSWHHALKILKHVLRKSLWLIFASICDHACLSTGTIVCLSRLENIFWGSEEQVVLSRVSRNEPRLKVNHEYENEPMRMQNNACITARTAAEQNLLNAPL